jgi:hypothetical protein
VLGRAVEIALEPLVQPFTVMVEVTVEAELQKVEVVHVRLSRGCVFFKLS